MFADPCPGKLQRGKLDTVLWTEAMLSEAGGSKPYIVHFSSAGQPHSACSWGSSRFLDEISSGTCACLPPVLQPCLHLCREFSLPTMSPAVRSIQEISSLGLRTGTIATSLVVQWLRLCAPNAEGSSLIPGQGTRPHMPQLRFTRCNWRFHAPQLRFSTAKSTNKRNRYNKENKQWGQGTTLDSS